MYKSVYVSDMEETIKGLKRDIGVISITDDFNFNPKLSNLVKYDNEIVVRRKKILGLPIGKKYTLENGSLDSALYRAVKHITDNHGVIISGSCSLRIFGLIDRRVCDDIDVIASQETINKMSELYSEYTYNTYGSGSSPDLNYVKSFVIKSTKVDVFLDNGDIYRMVGDIKVHDPFQLMGVKMGMGRTKDVKDCQDFIKLLKEKAI